MAIPRAPRACASQAGGRNGIGDMSWAPRRRSRTRFASASRWCSLGDTPANRAAAATERRGAGGISLLVVGRDRPPTAALPQRSRERKVVRGLAAAIPERVAVGPPIPERTALGQRKTSESPREVDGAIAAVPVPAEAEVADPRPIR